MAAMAERVAHEVLDESLSNKPLSRTRGLVSKPAPHGLEIGSIVDVLPCAYRVTVRIVLRLTPPR
jgi:hypothetical protein